MFNLRQRILIATAAATLLCSSATIAAEGPATPDADNSQTTLTVGEKAPNFTRTTTAGKKVSLKSFRGKKPVILYFYPKDETKGCTAEACGFRDFVAQMPTGSAEVIGISGDSDESHKAFANHYSLPFDLLSDSDNTLLNLYHVPLFKGSLHKRVTFVIDKHGVICNIIQNTNEGSEHVKEATAAVKALTQ